MRRAEAFHNIIRRRQMKNLVQNGNFSGGTVSWNSTSNFTVVDGIGTMLSTAANEYTSTTIPIAIGNLYYLACDLGTLTATTAVRFGFASGVSPTPLPTPAIIGTQRISGTTTGLDAGLRSFIVIDYRGSLWDTVSFDNFVCINLTATFGGGNEPTKAQMDTLMATFPNRWFNGTVSVRRPI